MAITDYIFQEEVVLKKDIGTWLINKMIAAGWQSVGSNPPTSPTDTTSNRFYAMKTKRDSDGLECIIALNDYYLRTQTNSNSAILVIYPLTDYTPGASGTPGTSSRTLVNVNGSGLYFFYLHYNSASYALDTQFTIRFCITKTNVTLIVRGPSNSNIGPSIHFFGLPDNLLKEKVTSGTIVLSNGYYDASNDQVLAVDTPLNVSSVTNHYELNGYWIAPPKSPDSSGQFPLMPGYSGDSTTGLRHRIPSFFFLANGGVLDKDIIQVNGMNFEIAVTYQVTPQYGSTRTFAYRIS